MGDIKLYHGDCLEVMRGMEDASIDLIVTSPPYLNLREYSSWNSYEDYMVDVDKWFTEMVRILKKGGHICWNIQNTFPSKNEK